MSTSQKKENTTAPPTYEESIHIEYSTQTQSLQTPSMHTAASKTVSKQASGHHMSAQDEFMTTCCDIMKNVEGGLQERHCLLTLGDCKEENTKKRKHTLAADSIQNVASILFVANKLLYSDSQHNITSNC